MLAIFRREPEGGVLWVGTAKDEEEVREMFKKLDVASPGVYFTYDHSTGIKRTMKPEEFGGDGQPKPQIARDESLSSNGRPRYQLKAG
jgi:hypothetical protein